MARCTQVCAEFVRNVGPGRTATCRPRRSFVLSCHHPSIIPAERTGYWPDPAAHRKPRLRAYCIDFGADTPSARSRLSVKENSHASQAWVQRGPTDEFRPL